MTSKSASKWATDDDEETAAALALRKKEKEDRKRLKEERARKAAAAPSPSTSPRPVEDSGRPTKRQRTSQEHENGVTGTPEESANLLQFPSRTFGPCAHVEQFDFLNDIEEGSYGMVSRARTISSGSIVALKRLKMEHTNDGFPVTGLREIQTLMACRHSNVVKLLEVVMGDSLKE